MRPPMSYAGGKQLIAHRVIEYGEALLLCLAVQPE